MRNEQETYSDGNGFLTLEVYDRLVAQNKELAVENMYLKHELAQLKRMIFGSKSERHIGDDPSQLSLVWMQKP
jgi:hypothetical protein